jgi:hypothetical protein
MKKVRPVLRFAGAFRAENRNVNWRTRNALGRGFG